MRLLLTIIGSLLLSFTVANGQVYRVAEMNADQIRSLDKQKTIVLLTGGLLEQHGPHLPSFTDGYSNEWITQKIAASIASRPGWAVLVFPIIPLGHGGANEIGGTYSFPGTYSVRRTTLRSVFMDLAGELGEQGFRWVFIVHGHGSPYHNLMLDQAGDFFRDTYGGRMVHLRGLLPTKEQAAAIKIVPPEIAVSDADKKENGSIDLHAGLEETSRILFVRPDLVSPVYSKLPPLTTNRFEDLVKSSQPNWRGYLGSPRVANAKAGRQLQEYRASRDAALLFAILDGRLDERDIPRYSKQILKEAAAMKIVDDGGKNEMKIEQKQKEWMRSKGIE